jgi:hypothetical protein
VLQAGSVVAAGAVPALVQLLASQRRSCQVSLECFHCSCGISCTAVLALSHLSQQSNTFLGQEELVVAMLSCRLSWVKLLQGQLTVIAHLGVYASVLHMS